MTPRPHRAGRAWRALIALAALHALTAFPYPWEDTTLAGSWGRVSPDLVLVLTFAILASLTAGYRAWLAHLTVFALVFTPLYRFGDTIMPVYYGRPFQPWFDIDLIPGLVHLLTHQHPTTTLVGFGLGALGVIGLLWWLIYRATASVLRVGARPRWGYALLIGAQVLVLAAWVARQTAPDVPDPVMARGTHARALGEIAHVLTSGSWRTADRFAERARAADAALADCSTDLEGLAGVDVYVFFIESYGRSIFRDPELGPTFRAQLAALEKSGAVAGLSAATAFVTPAVSGGGSAFAHAEFLTGIPVENLRIFELLIANERPSLPRYFRAAGRRTITVHPAMTESWPAGRDFYGFDRELFQKALAYEGTPYGWGRMPDQFALARLLESEVRPAKQPLFVKYVSVTSHAPFSLLPVFVDDWSAAATAAAFAGPPARDFGIHWTNYATHPRLPEAYRATIHYSLRAMLGFSAQLERPSLVMILGDHQPPVKRLQSLDASFDVPLHVVTNRADLLAPFRDAGATPGLRPYDGGRGLGSHQFLARFLRAFSRGEATPR